MKNLLFFVLFLSKFKHLALWNMENLYLGLISKMPTLRWGEAISLTQ